MFLRSFVKRLSIRYNRKKEQESYSVHFLESQGAKKKEKHNLTFKKVIWHIFFSLEKL